MSRESRSREFLMPYQDIKGSTLRPKRRAGISERGVAEDKVTQYLRKVEARKEDRKRIRKDYDEFRKQNLHYVRSRPYAAVASVLISSATETVDDIMPTFDSLRETAAEVDEHVLILPHVNYGAGLNWRNAKSDVAEYKRRAKVIHEALMDTTVGTNTQLLVVQEHMASGATWPDLRNATGDEVGIFLDDHFSEQVEKARLIHDIPYFQIDADTTVTKDTFPILGEALRNNDGVFITGTLHHVGELMDKTPREVATTYEKDPNMRLLYFAELMRRRMFDHLGPYRIRGYLPDFGLGMKYGVLATLNGYEVSDSQNESYFLQEKSIAHLKRRWALERYVLQHGWGRGRRVDHLKEQIAEEQGNDFPNAYIDDKIADEMDTLVLYTPYIIKSSIRGIEANVRHHGRAALVPFDLGELYITYADYVNSKKKTKPEKDPSREEVIHLVNSIYSSFKDRGGELPQEDSHLTRDYETLVRGQYIADDLKLEELLMVLFPEFQRDDSEKLVYPHPIEVPEENWPKIAA